MSRCSWFTAITFGLALTFAALAQETIPTTLEGEPVTEPGQEDSTPAGEQNAEQEQIGSFDLLPAIQGIEAAIRDLIAEEDQIERQRQENRDIRDLDAQESMALWAKAMFWATFGTVLVAIVGVIYVRRTLMETRRIGQAQVRAYLAEDGIEFRWAHNDKGRPFINSIEVKWRNTGQSHARFCGMTTIVEGLSLDEMGTPFESAVEAYRNSALGNANIAAGRALLCGGATLTPQETEQWTTGEIGLAIYSVVAYRDVFGEFHRAESCSSAHHVYEQGKTLTRFKAYPHHNSAD